MDIKGDIIPNRYKRVYDYLGWDGACPNDVLRTVEAAQGDKIEVHVSSGGGNINTAVEMVNALKDYKGEVIVYVDSHAHSAASFICCAGRCVMRPGTLMMLHKASLQNVSGNSDTMRQAANALDAHDEAIVSIYQAKTGLPRDKLLDLMANETYMSAQQALELGFADEIADEPLQAVASATHFLSLEQIAKIEALIPEEPDRIALARAKLKLLDLEARR